MEKSGGRRGGGPRYNVNPALIDDRVEVPPRAKRVVSVDRSCIDTTSIFDRDPPRSHLEPRRYGEGRKDLKRVAATEIMEKLKKLQDETGEQLDVGDTLPPRRYVARQLRYIELLENQLKNVILAEEEEEYRAQRDREKRGGGKGETEGGKDESCSPRGDEQKRREESVEKHAGDPGSRRVADRVRNGFLNEEEEGEGEGTRERIERRTIAKEGEGGRVQQGKGSSVVVNGEAFRRRMYDEYVHKVLEREERRHHKVVKISTHEDIKKCEKGDKGGGMTTVEREFIERARDRLNKFGINLDGAEGEKDGGGEGGVEEEVVEEGVVKARCLIDGKEFEDSKKLPKHLQEFLDMPANVDDGESR